MQRHRMQSFCATASDVCVQSSCRVHAENPAEMFPKMQMFHFIASLVHLYLRLSFQERQWPSLEKRSQGLVAVLSRNVQKETLCNQNIYLYDSSEVTQEMSSCSSTPRKPQRENKWWLPEQRKMEGKRTEFGNFRCIKTQQDIGLEGFICRRTHLLHVTNDGLWDLKQS